jgi:hypothetical protein
MAYAVYVMLQILAGAVSPGEQHRSTPTTDQSSGDTSIVVTANPAMPVNPRTIVEPPPSLPGRNAEASAYYTDAARRAAQCATRGKLATLSLLREVVEGVVPSRAQERAMDWLTRQTATCGEVAAIFQVGSQITPSDSYLGTLRRGAFVAEALKAFAPDLALTRQQLNSAPVIERFVAREEPQAANRRPSERTYLKVAICLVREQPNLATRLVWADPVTTSTSAIQATMVENARHCVGNVRRVVVDRYEFRTYIADALYRWTLAARGVATLIPDDRSEAG